MYYIQIKASCAGAWFVEARDLQMKSRIWVVGVGLSFVLGGWAPAWAANYYVDDGSNDGDVWTPTAYGLDINNGLTPATPKATLANLIGTVPLAAGDVVYLDTGTYAPTGQQLNMRTEASCGT